MNRILLETIVKHVLANLAIIPSEFVKLGATKSLKSKDFLLTERMPFIMDDGLQVNRNVWGCQLSVEQQEIKLLLADCSLEENIPEYALLVQLKDNPYYGVYLVHSNEVDSEPMIGCSMNGKDWMECQTYLQATFLAAMEQMRDIGFTWSKCDKYKTHFEALLTFIKYHHSVYESKDEG